MSSSNGLSHNSHSPKDKSINTGIDYMSGDDFSLLTDIELDKAEQEIFEMSDSLVKEKLHELQCSPFSKQNLDVLFRKHLSKSAVDPVIRVIGVGGGGCNAVEHMINCNISGIEYICANTDLQVLSKMGANTIQLGSGLTKGLGAGTDPDIGRRAAQEDSDHISQIISGADMLFLTAGMGGGTGTGAISVIASIAKDLGVLTVAVVTEPFPFEGGKRRKVAEKGLVELRQNVDSVIVVPNEKLLTNLSAQVTILQAFKAANDVLKNAVQGIAEIITNPGLINVDFADVRSVMSEMGQAMMGTGSAHGENRAAEAARMATESPLLDDVNLKGARGIVCNITAGTDLSMREFEIVGDVLERISSIDANIIMGTSINNEMEGEIRVTIVACGLEDNHARKPMRLVGVPRHEPAVNRSTPREVAEFELEGDTVARERVDVRRCISRLGFANSDVTEMSYLDLPTFLRRQADKI